MKKLWLLALPLLMSMTVLAGDGKETTGIRFTETGWADVAKKAAKEKKLVFVDVYTTWCGPCKLLKRSTFPDKAVGEYFNAKFVSTAIDAEKGEGVDFATKYNVQGYPTMLILDKDGKELARTMGYIPPEQLLEFGKSVEGKK